MAGTCSIDVLAQMGGTWGSLLTDTWSAEGLRIRYGITGNGPLDCVSGTGDCQFTLSNMASAGGRLQGYYSPGHANCRSGWTYGIPLRVVFTDSADAAASISSITRSGSTATVTTTAPHGYSSNYWGTIAGAAQADYNGVFKLTVTGASTFTYTVPNTPATPATGTKTVTRAYVKHYGKIGSIKPEAGRYGSQKVRVVSYDSMRDLATAEVRGLSIQIDKTEAQLVTAVLDAVPAESQPVARSISTGIDSFGYAFHDVGSGAKALRIIKDVNVDAYAMSVIKGDGTFTMLDRHTRITTASSATFADSMHDFEAPSSLDSVYNVVRLTIHPASPDAAATTVLYADQVVREIPRQSTVEFWVTYRDPNTSTTLIGGLDVVNPLVAGTDYQGNSLTTGLGTVLTASLAVTITPFASTALVSIVNSADVSVFLVDTAGAAAFRVRGKGVYDRGPQTYESSVTQTSVRPLSIDLHYQDDPLVAQAYADFLRVTRDTVTNQPQSLGFTASGSATFVTQALAREPGDVITVSETMTGFSSVKAAIQSVELVVTHSNWLRCRFGLAPANNVPLWLWGVVGNSEWGISTVYGF